MNKIGISATRIIIILYSCSCFAMQEMREIPLDENKPLLTTPKQLSLTEQALELLKLQKLEEQRNKELQRQEKEKAQKLAKEREEKRLLESKRKKEIAEKQRIDFQDFSQFVLNLATKNNENMEVITREECETVLNYGKYEENGICNQDRKFLYAGFKGESVTDENIIKAIKQINRDIITLKKERVCQEKCCQCLKCCGFTMLVITCPIWCPLGTLGFGVER